MKAPRWIAAAGLVTLLFTGSAAGAATAARPSPSKYADMDNALSSVESGLAQINRSGRITEAFDPDTAVGQYLETIRKSYDATMKTAADQAKGDKAGAAAASATLSAWEDAMRIHRPRADKLLSGLTEINLKVRDGRVLFAPELLKKLPKEEIDELKQWLTPDAIKKYQALDKTLFADVTLPGETPRSVLLTEMAPPAGCRECRLRQKTVLSWLDDALAPDAEAVASFACIAICKGASSGECVACVAGAVGLGAVIVTRLEDAFADCNKKPTKVGRALCKAGVVVALLAYIA